MVDLHQSEPGLPEGHPWLLLSRWGIAWRTTLATAVVGMLGTLVLATMSLGDRTAGNPFIGWLGIGFGLLPALIFGGLSAILGPWLRRYYPFSQGVIFGLIGAGAVALLLVAVDVVDQLRRCPLWQDSCDGSWVGLSLGIVMLAGLPLAIMAGGGLGLAI